MITYEVFAGGTRHQIEAVTFSQGQDLRFIGENGSIVAVFTTFDWLKVVPAEEKPAAEDASTTEAPVLEGQ
jgi:hypothetical protein